MTSDEMRLLITRTRGRLLRSWRAMLQHLRDANAVEAIADRLHTNDAVADLAAAAAKFAADEHAAYVAAGQAAARSAERVLEAPVRKKLLHFDALDPPAAQWATRNRLDKIREITQDQRDMIRAVLIDGARRGLNPRDVAEEIYDSIGLTEHQLEIVQNYRHLLESGQLSNALTRELRDGRHDRALAAAIRDGRMLEPAQIDTMVDRYRANFQVLRAETIARTEGLRVAHQGSDELYRQATERGDIEAAQIERKWIHTPRAKYPRSDHAAMHGQIRGAGEPFETPTGVLLMFPCDPDAPAEETISCSCVVTTRLRRLAA